MAIVQFSFDKWHSQNYLFSLHVIWWHLHVIDIVMQTMLEPLVMMDQAGFLVFIFHSLILLKTSENWYARSCLFHFYSQLTFYVSFSFFACLLFLWLYLWYYSHNHDVAIQERLHMQQCVANNNAINSPFSIFLSI